jgi:hypothetical protein
MPIGIVPLFLKMYPLYVKFEGMARRGIGSRKGKG